MSDCRLPAENGWFDFDGGTGFETGARGRTLIEQPAYRVSHYQCDFGPNDRPSYGSHQTLTVGWVRRGAFTYNVEGVNRLVGSRFTLLGNSGAEYVLSHEVGCGDECTLIELRPELLIGSEQPIRFFRTVLPPRPRICAFHEALVRGQPGSLQRDESVCGLLLEVLREMDAPGLDSRKRDDSRGRLRAWAACEFIHRHFDEMEHPLTLACIAATFELSPYHFLRVFRRHVGLTPYQYVLQIRLCHAVEMLRDTRMPVTEIALAAGFKDLSNFIRTFRRTLGSSPSGFRTLPTTSWYSKNLQALQKIPRR